MEVEFDERKARSNQEKHGVSFKEASMSLIDPIALCVEDPDSFHETRWITWGVSSKGRLLAVVYTLRGERIRIISARKATRRERERYAKGIRSI